MNAFIIVLVLMLLFASIIFFIPLWRSQQKANALILSLVFIVITSGTYWRFGSSQQLPLWFAYQEKQQAVKAMLKELKTPEVIIARMEQHLAQKPDSVEGWFLLGRLYANVGRIDDAKKAFAKAKNLLPQKETGLALNVHIELAKTLKTKNLDLNTTVFIFAKAIDGPQVPLAVVRKRLRDLPLDITLSDANAMTPMATLSKYPKLYVVARIAKANTPQAQPGDIQGKSQNIDASHINATLNVAINEVVQ